ncbi:hypothetical protein PS3A_18060 [Pseudomonas sp. 3A(2025)]
MAGIKKEDPETQASVNLTDAIPIPAVAQAVVIYRDTLYTSRSLFLPDERELAVLRGHVTVLADDVEAQTYLAGHPEFQLLAE